MKEQQHSIVILNNIDKLIQKFTVENTLLLQEYLKFYAYKKYFFEEAFKNSTENIKWFYYLADKEYFLPKNNPCPVKLENEEGYKISQWSALIFLKHIAKINKFEKNHKTKERLEKIINSIINYKDKNDKRIDNWRTDLDILEIISTFPLETINQLHLDFIEEALQTRWGNDLFASVLAEQFIPKILEGKSKGLLLRLLEIVLSFKEEQDIFGIKYRLIIDDRILKKIIEKYKKDLASICGKEAAMVGIEKIKQIVKKGENEFGIHHVWTIRDEKQLRIKDDYHYQIINFIRNIYEETSPDFIREDISFLLKDEHSIFKRIAIHAINYHFQELAEIFWLWQGNPLENHELKPELYELFKNHSKNFSKEQILQVINWINIQQYEDKDKKLVALGKREWLETLLESKNDKVLKEYEKYRNINPEKITHPGKVIWMEPRGIEDDAQISVDDLLKMDNEKIADYLVSLKQEEASDRFYISNTKDCFRKAIIAKPNKFTENLTPFLLLQLQFQSIILQGLYSAWQERKDFNWEKLFNYVLSIIDPENENYQRFWEDENKKDPYNYKYSIISEIADLIHEGTRQDENAFKEEFLVLAEKILFILVNKTESNLTKFDDLQFRIINSAKYKIFRSMISYSLRYIRLNKQLQDINRWEKEVKEDFTKRLDKEESPEFYYTLGAYLLNLYYLDKNWIIENINKIFPKEKELLWKSATVGYFVNLNRVYPEIYKLLEDNNILLKAVNYKFSEEYISEKVVQTICIGYIEGWEEMANSKSLINQILKNRRDGQLLELVRFIKAISREIPEKMQEKIKPLWSEIYKVILKKEENIKFQNLAFELFDWIDIAKVIDDDIFKWLKLSVKYVNQYNPGMIYEKFYHNINKNPEKIGLLFLEMLKYKVPIPYNYEDIIGTVELLYSKGLKIIANQISDVYVKNGYFFLRKTYETYNLIAK